MKASDPQEVHRLPKNIYLDYIKLFPVTQIPEVKTYTTLILTLIAIIGFSVFAINPTLETIIELRKTREDNRFAEASLQEKILAMQTLREQYSALGPSLIRISEAIPNNPEAPTLLAKIQTLAVTSNVTVVKLESQEVEVTKQNTGTTPSSFVMNLTVSGTYQQILTFLTALHTFDRIIALDTISISRQDQGVDPLTASIRARAFFHPEVKVEGVKSL